MSTNITDLKEKSVDVAVDAMKLTIGLASGALVYIVGFVATSSLVDEGAKHTLFWSSIALLISIVGGSLGSLRFPMMLAESSINLEDPKFAWPTRIHHVAFLVGIVSLVFALDQMAFSEVSVSMAKVQNASVAVKLAKASLPSSQGAALQAIELIKGLDPSSPSQATWHIRFALTDQRRKTAHPMMKDVFVNVADGTIQSE